MREIIAVKFDRSILFYVFLADGTLKEAIGLEGLRSLIRQLVADESLEMLLKFFEHVEQYFIATQRIDVILEKGKLFSVEVGTVSFQVKSELFYNYHDARDFMIGAKANYGL